MFFDNSWRKKRARNTFIVLFTLVFVFGLTPLSHATQPTPDNIHIWFWEHVGKRLETMYQGKERIPALAAHAKNGISLIKQGAGRGYIFRDSLFYFAPDKMKRDFESIWPRSARNEQAPWTDRTMLKKGSGNRSAGVPPAERSVVREARSDGKSGRPDTPVGRDDVVVQASRLQGGGDTVAASSSSDSPLGSSRWAAEPRVREDEDRGWIARALDALNTAFGVPTANAWWEGVPEHHHRIDFYHTDHLGSTRVVTEASGLKVETIDYLPFGEIFRDTYPWDDVNFEKHRHKYTGQMFDYLTGLYYYGARYYDPEIGRFTQADTVVPEPLDGQAFNRYSYVNNNPYRYVDPSGHFFLEILTALVIAAVLYAVTDLVYSAITGQHFASWEGLGQSMGMAVGLAALDCIFPGIGFVIGCVSLFVSTVQAVQGDPGALANVIVSLAMIGMSCYIDSSSSSSDPEYQQTGGTKADFEGEKAKLQQNGNQGAREGNFSENQKNSGNKTPSGPSSTPKAAPPKISATTGQAPRIGAAQGGGYPTLGYALLDAAESIYQLTNDIVNTYMYSYGLPKAGQKDFFALVRDSANNPSLGDETYLILVKGERTYAGLLPKSDISMFFSQNIQNYPNSPINPYGYSMRNEYYLPPVGTTEWNILYLRSGAVPSR